MKRPIVYSLCKRGAPVAVVFISLCLGCFVMLLLVKGAPSLGKELFFADTPALDAILGKKPVWDGLWPALVGTLCLVGLTLFLALVPGIGCGIFLAEYASPKVSARIGTVIDVLAGTPSIVMGLFGFTLILFLRHTLLPDANTCLLLAAGCLSLLVLPVLIVSTKEAIAAVPAGLRLTGASLGFSKSQSIRYIQLPAAAPGILSGVVLALGRAAEDTAVIMLTGVVANAGLPAGLGAKFEAIPFSIFYTTAQYQTQAELSRAFGASLVLLLLAGGLILTAYALGRGYRRRWRGNR